MRRFLCYYFVLIFFLILTPEIIHAAGFNQVIVRFDRMKASTPTTGLICAAPATLENETSIEITFPSSFNVNTTLSNWTVSTTNILAGSTAWPGIGTATTISGNSVTFPSGDLAVGNLYCFRWTNSTALTTGSGTGTISGQLNTLNGSNSTIDSKQYFLSLSNNDQVTLTASVTPNASDIDFSLSSTASDGSTLPEGQENTFTISYRSDLEYTTDIQIVASWDRGLIEGSSSNYVDIFDYVVGSATTSDEGAVPTVDLVNRTITWDITNFSPSVSTNNVTFKLATQADFASSLRATSNVNAVSKIVNTTLHNKQLTYYVNGTISPTATPTPTSAPGPTSTPGPTTTPQPSHTPTPLITRTPKPTFRFKTISISEIADTSFTINFRANKETAYQISYGTSRNKLNQKIQSTTLRTNHSIIINKLKPGTRYYFVIELTDIRGKVIKSDLFIVKTATERSSLSIAKNSIIISSNNIIVSFPSYQSLLIPLSLPVTFQISINEPEIIASLEGLFRSRSVLGINTLHESPPLKRATFVEIHPGQFTADILTPSNTGSYDFILEVQDIYGGLYEKTIPYHIKMSQPLSIYDKNNRNPVDNAQIEIAKYQESSRQYAPLSNIHSYPKATNDQGQLPVILTQGSYILNITTEKYLPYRTEFTIDDSTTAYPHIGLESNSNFSATLTYYWNTFTDLLSFLSRTGSDFFASSRTRDLLFFLLLASSVILTAVTLSLRLNYGFIGIISAIIFSIHRDKHGPAIVVSNQQGHAVVGVKIYILDKKNHLLCKIQTGLDGIVHIPPNFVSLTSFPLKIMLYHPNYYTYPFTIDEHTFTNNTIPATLSSYEKEASGKHLFHWVYDILLVSASDTLIVGSYILTILFMKVHGLEKTLPLLMASSLLMVIWLFFIKQIHRELKIA